MTPLSNVSIVKDIYPGTASGSDPHTLRPGKNLLYFLVDSSLWVSNGTEAGTHIVSTTYSGGVTDTAENLTVIDDIAFYTNPAFLWRSDGTVDGTGVIRFAKCSNLIAFEKKLVFTSSDGIHDSAVWTSDGTSYGTVLVKAGLTLSSTHPRFYLCNARLYFNGEDGGKVGLIETDGTASGTRVIAESSETLLPISIGGRLYVVSQGILYTVQSGGLTPVVDFAEAGIDFTDLQGKESNGSLVFAGFSFLDGTAIWRTDGTQEGTFRLTDWSETTPFSYSLTSYGGTVFFAYGTEETRLWATNGTLSGTRTLGSMSLPLDAKLSVGQGGVYFNGEDAANGRQLWRTDGTEKGTWIVGMKVYLPKGSGPSSFASIGANVFFRAAGTQFITDGTRQGTRKITSTDGSILPAAATPAVDADNSSRELDEDDLPVVNASSYRYGDSRFVQCGERVVFSGPGEEPVPYLWSCDVQGRNASRIGPPNAIAPYGFTLFNKVLYFSVFDSASGYELWRTDGTNEGTALVRDIESGQNSSTPDNFCAQDNLLFFTTGPVSNSDGTYSNARLMCLDKDGNSTQILAEKLPSIYLDDLQKFGDGVVFKRWTPGTPREFELWFSDGTPERTKSIWSFGEKDFSILVLGPVIYLVPRSSDSIANELWISDGTEGGTLLLKSFLHMEDPVAFGDYAFFPAEEDETVGQEPWISDGTVAGTYQVKDINPGFYNSIPGALDAATVGNCVYFRAFDNDHRHELWKSDGTAIGTSLVADIVPGMDYSYPHYLASAGDKLYFAATTPDHETEPWVMPVVLPDLTSSAVVAAGGPSNISLGTTGVELVFLKSNRMEKLL